MKNLIEKWLPARFKRGSGGLAPGVPAASPKEKVFGIGLPRTGTTTLGKCFEILGYRHASFDYAALEALAAGNTQHALETAGQFDAFEDAPWFMLYEQLDARYPDCRFILTTRRDSSQWLKGALSHDARYNTDNSPGARAKQMVIAIYGARGVDFNIPGEIYRFHNQKVMDYFSGRENKILRVCWDTGDDWKQLCGFLGTTIPQNLSFPHENASPPET